VFKFLLLINNLQVQKMWKLYNSNYKHNSRRISKYNSIKWNLYWFLLLASSSFLTVANCSAGNCYNGVITTKGTRNGNVFGSSHRLLVGIHGNPNSGISRSSRDRIIALDKQQYIVPKETPLYDDLSSHRTIEPVEFVSAVRLKK
jgi:hypothetical protein